MQQLRHCLPPPASPPVCYLEQLTARVASDSINARDAFRAKRGSTDGLVTHCTTKIRASREDAQELDCHAKGSISCLWYSLRLEASPGENSRRKS